MDVGKTALQANALAYDNQTDQKIIEGSPHLKHKSLQKKYSDQVENILHKINKKSIKVLDLGAGNGSQTLLFLMLDCQVTAVDISQQQLDKLSEKCQQWKNNFSVICSDINKFAMITNEKFDIVIINSVLHHIPDYSGLLNNVCNLVDDEGCILTFQDPIYYSTLKKLDVICSNLFYYLWRLAKGDLKEGLKRFIRRKNGNFSNPTDDDVEYHVVRDGVNQDEIQTVLSNNKFEVHVIRYFSTQSTFFQKIGECLKIENTFGVCAKKIKV